MECKKLYAIIKNKNLNIDQLFDWLNNICSCEICEQFNLLYNYLDDNKEFLNNTHFKKIHLTDKMKEQINIEISNKTILNNLFKLIKK